MPCAAGVGKLPLYRDQHLSERSIQAAGAVLTDIEPDPRPPARS
jgi:hypothetical protein